MTSMWTPRVFFAVTLVSSLLSVASADTGAEAPAQAGANPQTRHSGGNQPPSVTDLMRRYGPSLEQHGFSPDMLKDLTVLGKFATSKAMLAAIRKDENLGRALGELVAALEKRDAPPVTTAPPQKPAPDRDAGKTPPTTGPGNETGKVPTRQEQLYDQLVSQYPWMHGDIGRLAAEREDYRKSLLSYAAAIDNGKRDPATFTGYGNAAYQLKDYQLARDAAALALQMEPSNQAANAVYQLSQGRTSEVRLPSALGGSVFGATDNSGSGGVSAAAANVGYAAAPTDLGPGRAPSIVTTQAPSNAQLSAAATENARHALMIKENELAAQHATKALELYAQNGQALNLRAIAYSRMQRYSDAVTDASAALTLAPNNVSALYTRSWAFSSQKQYREALHDAEASLMADPRNAYTYQSKAFALAGLGDRAGAIDSLRMAATIDARFKNAYERALQMPADQDMTLLFDERAMAAASAAPARPAQTPKRFARMALLSGTGGLLIALGILHVVSASWREKVRMTVRRVLAPADAVGDEAVATAGTPLPGSSAFWTQYDLVKEIGMGGMGVVYEAVDRTLERRVAVKKMRDEIRIDPQERQRFVNEAKVVASLRHPNIVDIYAIVEDGADVYLVFEYVEGRTLHDRLRSEGAFSFGEGLKAFRAICGAVEHAHAAKVIHRDLKPSNVMVTSDGRIKVMDFGVARQAKDALTKMSMTNTIVGTPPYMAPEQEQGTVRRESDVYALAVCFYEMLTGQLPFAGTGSGMLLNKINGKHIPPTQRVPSLPAGLDAVLAHALHPDPEKRHHTPAELLADLEKLA